MLSCERCGTSFSEMRSGRLASCPRCRVRDGVSVPLVARDGLGIPTSAETTRPGSAEPAPRKAA